MDVYEEAAQRAWEAVFARVQELLAEGKKPAEISRMLGHKGRSAVTNWIAKKATAEKAEFPDMLRYMGVLGLNILDYIPQAASVPSIRRLSPNAPTETVEGEGLQELSVYDVAGAGPAIEVSELTPLFSVYAPPDYLRRADYAIMVDGHSMEPLIPNRSVVGIKTGVPFVANELYAARIPYEGMVIKRVGVDRTTNEFVFKSQNPDKESYPDFRLNINEAEEIIVGRVVWVMWGY